MVDEFGASAPLAVLETDSINKLQLKICTQLNHRTTGCGWNKRAIVALDT